jgi:hypothetical protein
MVIKDFAAPTAKCAISETIAATITAGIPAMKKNGISLKRGKSSDLVLAGVDGGKLSAYTRRLFASLEIKDASFHTLRHTAR